MNIKRIIREEMDDFDWVKEAKPTFGFFIDQFFRVGGYRAFMEALKDYFGIGETVLLTGDLYLAGGTENSVIKLNQEPFRIMDVNQGKIRVKPIKLSKEHSDMWDSWIGEPYIELGDAKEDREIIIERPNKPILEQDDFDWIKDINPTKRDKAVFLNKEKYKTTTEYTDVEVGDKFIPSNGYKVWTVFSKLLRHGQVGSEKGWTYALGINDENGRHKVTYMSFMNHKDLGILNLTYRPWRKIVNINESDDLDWIRNINPVAFDDFINKAFYFDPTAEEGDEDYAKLVDKLNDLGFSPVYGTTSFVGEGNYIAGLFSYLDFDRNPKYVFTHDDYDTRTWDGYEEHIKGYALGESEARDDLEVVDARAFVTQFT